MFNWFSRGRKKLVSQTAVEKETNFKQSPNQSPKKETLLDNKLEKKVLTNKEKNNLRFKFENFVKLNNQK